MLAEGIDALARQNRICAPDAPAPGDPEILIRRIMDVEPWPLSYIDAGCRYRRVNRTYEQWFGHTVREIEGRHIRDVLGEEAWQAIRPYVERALSGEEVHYEREIPYRNAGPRLVRVTYTPDRDASGCIRGFIAHIMDVGEWRQVEAALLESEERYRRLFEDDLTGDVITSPGGRILACNSAFVRIFGFSSVEEAKSTPIEEMYVFPGERAELLKRLREEGKVESRAGTRRRRDGALIHVVENAVGRTDADGKLVEIVEYIHDDTDRWRKEEEVRRSEALYRAMARNTPGGAVFVLDTDLRYLVAEGSLLKTPGVTREMLEGRTPAEVFGESSSKEHEERLRRALQGETLTHEYVQDGRVFWSHYTPLRDEKGAIQSVLVLSLDITERKQAEERFRAVLENSLDAAYRRDLTTDRYDYMSPVIERITGFTPEEMNAMSTGEVLARVHPEDRRSVKASVADAATSGIGVLEYRLRGKDGRYRWISDRFTVTRDAEGRPLYRGGTVHDITERKRAEEVQHRLIQENRRLATSLAQECDLLATIMDNTDVHIAYLDAEFRFVRVNPAYVSCLGYTEEELIGKNHFELFPNADSQAVFERVRKTGEPFRCFAMPIDVPELYRDGVTYWDWSLVPVKNAKEGIQGFVLSLADVTGRIRAQKALQKSEERFRAIFDNIPVGVVIQCADGTVTAMNGAAERLFGVTEKNLGSFELIDTHLRTIREDGSPYPAREHPSMETVKTGRAIRDAIMGVYHQEERDYRWIAINTVPRFRDGEERPYEVFIAFSDITERKQSQEALLRHTEELARLNRDLIAAHREANLYLDILTHDLGNTENVSNLYADLLIETLPEETAGYAGKLKRSIEKSIEILGLVATIRRIHAGPPDIVPVDLNVVINSEIGRFPEVAVHSRSAVSHVLADDHLSEVFSNLLENAIKFGGPEVGIIIRTEEEEGVVLVSVEDTGPGVPDDEKEEIFFRYEQQKRGVGEGLGLYLVQILIERYGGRIWVEDRVPGYPEEGAVFRFTLKKAERME